MIFADKLNYTLLSIYSINKNGKKNYNLYNKKINDLKIKIDKKLFSININFYYF